MIKEPSFGTPCGLLTCLLTLSLRTTPIGVFPDYFSFSHFLETSCCLYKKRLNSLKFALNFASNKLICLSSKSTILVLNSNPVQWNRLHFLKKTVCALRVNLTIYHSFSSCQPLAASQNISPTRTGNPIHEPHGMINFSNRAVTGFWHLKTSNKIWIKRFQKCSLGEFWIMKVVTGLFSFCRFCQSWNFYSEYLQK